MSLIDNIRDAGIVGAGGAGFPTHVKVNCKAEYIIANGGVVVESMTIVSLDGVTVASRGGNVINVSDIAAGNYIVVVRTASGSVAKKVIIKH